MKKLLLSSLIIVNYIFASYGQMEKNDTIKSNQFLYCEIVGESNLLQTKVRVAVDFGQEINYWTQYRDKFLVDENGKRIKFNSMIDALNYMAKLGWKFEQAYVVSTQNQLVYHYLLSKKGTLSDVKNGLTVKRDLED